VLTVNKLFTKDYEQQIHAWVNYESILQKCVVGRLVNEELFKLPEVLKTSTDVSINDFNMDWFQQLGFLCFVFYTKTPYPEVHKHKNIIFSMKLIVFSLVTTRIV
jgi:hypothetical protein